VLEFARIGARKPTLDSGICRAMFERRLLTLTFKHGTGVVEPYCFGRTKEGNDVLRAYQVRGASEDAEPTGWKLFRFEDIVAMALTDKPFFPRAEFRRNERVFDRIHCQI